MLLSLRRHHFGFFQIRTVYVVGPYLENDSSSQPCAVKSGRSEPLRQIKEKIRFFTLPKKNPGSQLPV